MTFVEIPCSKCGRTEKVSEERAQEILRKKKKDPRKKWICTDCYIQSIQRLVILQPPIEAMGLEPEDFAH